jgi:hypothetical protein
VNLGDKIEQRLQLGSNFVALFFGQSAERFARDDRSDRFFGGAEPIFTRVFECFRQVQGVTRWWGVIGR